jgi:hypothetical protein
LISHEDYIVGTPDLLFTDSEDFNTLVQSNLDREIQLFVYNANTDTIRPVCITPSKNWGGPGWYAARLVSPPLCLNSLSACVCVGSLGCDVGYGYLHRIPTRQESDLPIPEALPASFNFPMPPSTTDSSQPGEYRVKLQNLNRTICVENLSASV